MQLSFPPRKNIQDRRARHGLAFIMEALVLLLFLTVSAALIMQVFSGAYTHAESANSLSQAVILASNDAERFEADPTAGEGTRYFTFDGTALEETGDPGDGVYSVTRTVDEKSSLRGTLYSAVISVEQDGETLYLLSTANYVSGEGGDGRG